MAPPSPPPHVILVITKGETGGAQTHLLSLCAALREQSRLEVVVGGSAGDSPLASELARLGVPLHVLPTLRNSLSPWSVLRATRDLLRLMRRQQPQLLHAHSAVAGVVVRLAGALLRVPVAYTVHGFGFKPEAPGLQRRVAFIAEWLLAPLTRHMICVSSHERTLAARLPISESRISVVRNGLQDVVARAAPGGRPVRMIMVARFAAPKRHDLLLRALAGARDRQGSELPATLAGDGPHRASCEALAQTLGLQQVSFPGVVLHVPELLAQHHIFALASDHEGLPISIIEAMRAGLPIVASDLPGIRELVRTGTEAVLVPDDADAWAEALERLAASPELRERLGTAARRRYESLFTAQTMAAEVQALYVQIAAHEQPNRALIG